MKILQSFKIINFLIFWLFLYVYVSLSEAYEKPFIKIISPSKGVVWEEGKTYKIRWKAKGVDKVCIEVFMGGKDRGFLDNCQIDANKGYYEWHIPRAYISGFGINKETKMRLFICDPQEVVCAKSSYFTIKKAVPEQKTKFLKEPKEKEFIDTIQRYFQALSRRQYKKAYALLLKKRITIYVNHYGLNFMPPQSYRDWVFSQRKIGKIKVLNIKSVAIPEEKYLLGIRTYKVKVIIQFLKNRSWNIPSGNHTFYIDLIKGTDNKIRILGIGSGP